MDTIERIQRYTSTGMGDHGPHAIRRGPDGIDHVPHRQQHLRRRAAGARSTTTCVDKANSPNWNNSRSASSCRSTTIRASATARGSACTPPCGGCSRTTSSACSSAACATRTTSPTTSPAKRSRSTATWNGTSTRRGTARSRTVHMIPGGDDGYRNGTGKFQDEYFDTHPGAAAPAPRLAGRRRVLSELRVSGEVLRQPVRGGLVARPAALHGADAGRRDLHRPRGSRRVRPRRADADHRPRGRARRQHLPDDRRRPGQGGLYKVTWTGAKPAQPDMTGILAVVRQPQPLSSWGWAAIEKVKASMGASFGAELEKLARTASAASQDRMRAVLEMQRHGAAPSAELLKALIKDRDADVRAAAVYVAGVQTSDAREGGRGRGAQGCDPLVQRRAAEALVRQGLTRRAELCAGRRHLRAAADRRSLRPLLRTARARAHAARRVDGAGHGRDQRRRAHRRAGGAREHRAGAQAQSELRPIFEKLVALMKRPTLTAAGEDPGAARFRGRRDRDAERRRSGSDASRSTTR